MLNIQWCSECTYKGPSDTFPLKKSGKGHTKTCSHCNDRNKLKIATASHTWRDNHASQSFDAPKYCVGDISTFALARDWKE
ncbi:hypothetical protein BS47DRAFT_1356574, partial [Hydnum rufescens UP504]